MKKIIVKTNIHGDIIKVYNEYTRPEHVLLWNFVSDNLPCPQVHNDVRLGGRFYPCIETNKGSEDFYFEGTYDDVLLWKRISYETGDGRSVLVEFKNSGDNNIDVTVTIDADSESPHKMQREGWQKILDNFKKYVEST